MVIITGTGRSGTSLVAGIYRELGFDPGGKWSQDNSAGWEAPEIVQANRAVLEKLNVTAHGPPRDFRTLEEVLGARAARVVKDVVPQTARRKVRKAMDRFPGRSASSLRLLPHDLVSSLAARESEHLLAITRNREVAKDPLFCWTLPVWLMAGVPISHVVITTRRLDDSIASHDHAAHLRFRSSTDARNSFIYGVGSVLTSCLDHDIPYSLVRFPDFIGSPVHLYRSLAFPRPIVFEEFEQAFERLVDPSLIHSFASDLRTPTSTKCAAGAR